MQIVYFGEYYFAFCSVLKSFLDLFSIGENFQGKGHCHHCRFIHNCLTGFPLFRHL